MCGAVVASNDQFSHGWMAELGKDRGLQNRLAEHVWQILDIVVALMILCDSPRWLIFLSVFHNDSRMSVSHKFVTSSRIKNHHYTSISTYTSTSSLTFLHTVPHGNGSSDFAEFCGIAISHICHSVT